MLILAVPGSLRSGSYTTTLLRTVTTAVASHDNGVEPDDIVEIDLRSLPFYDTGSDGATEHEAVIFERERIRSADALIVSTPEYNGATPAALKNWLDWMTRPRKVHTLTGKPVLVIGGSPSPRGANKAVEYVRMVLEFNGADVVGDSVAIADLEDHLDRQTGAVDDHVRAILAPAVAALVEVLSRSR